MKLAPAGETSMKGGKPYVEVHRLNDVVLLLLLPLLLVIWLRLWSSMRIGDQSYHRHWSQCQCQQVFFFYKSLNIMFEIAEFSPPPASVALDSFGLPVAATSNIELTPPSINSSLHFSVSADAMEVFQQGRNNLILPCHNCSLASATTQLPAGQDKQSTNTDNWAHP